MLFPSTVTIFSINALKRNFENTSHRGRSSFIDNHSRCGDLKALESPFNGYVNLALEQGPELSIGSTLQTMRSKRAAFFLAVIIANTAPTKAQCGMEKTFKIYVERSYHADKVAASLAGCKTKKGSCTTSGTIFIVSTNGVKYAILLLDGIQASLEVGNSYSAFLLCLKAKMMVPENRDGKPIAAFYVLEQRTELNRRTKS